MKKLILPLFAVALCGCPANPKIIEVQNGKEEHLSCQQLDIEITNAKQAKTDAHAEDNFRFGNIFPPTGIMSVQRIMRADANATKRLELLNKIAQEKGCMNNSRQSNYPNYNGAPIEYHHTPQPR